MKNSSGKKILALMAVMAFAAVTAVFAQSADSAQAASSAAQEVTAEQGGSGSAVKYIAAAVAVGLACIASGHAVGKIGAAAMGAMAENSELSGKALPFVGLAEGICLWGFLVALFIILM